MTSSRGVDASAAEVVVLTRPGCHLCDVARDVVSTVCGDAGWSEVDVDAEPSRSDGTRDRWSDLVPVVTVGGRYLTHFRVDEHQLRSAVTGAAPSGEDL